MILMYHKPIVTKLTSILQGMKKVADEISSSVKDIAKSKVLRTVDKDFIEVQYTPVEAEVTSES